MCSKMPSDFSYEVRLYKYRRKCDVFACLTLHKNTHPLYLTVPAKSVALGSIAVTRTACISVKTVFFQLLQLLSC